MDNILENIVKSKKITILDEIYFEKIIDVVSQLFTDYNGVSQLIKGYRINENQQLWFLNLDKEYNLDEKLKTGYYNWISNDNNFIYQFNTQKDSNKRLKDIQKLESNPQQFITFIQFFDKTKKSSYKFYGVYSFKNSKDELNQTMIYEKISDEFIYSFKK